MSLVRLQKFISSAGVCSRRQAEVLISSGKVKINGETATIGAKVDPEKDTVKINRQIVKPRENFIYLVLNKPTGYTTTRADAHAEKTIYDLLPKDLKNKVWPVGRLDKSSEGLLILTNDGELTQQLTHPKFEHEKEYLVQTDEPLTPVKIARLKKAVVDDGQILTGKIEGQENEFKVVLREGKKRQIRKMFEAVGARVIFLKRVRENKLRLGDLRSGEWKYIEKKEII